MTVTYLAGKVLQLLSADSLPQNLPVDSIAIETDTGIMYTWDGIQWNPFHEMPLPHRGYMWGAYMPTTNTTDIGLLNGTTTSGTATQANDADGHYKQFASGVTIGTVVGKKKDAVFLRRESNCWFSARFNVSHADGNIRHCHGFTTDTASLTNTDTYLATTDSGVLVGFRTTDTNWMIFHNSGAGAMSTIDLGIAKSTAVRMVEIRSVAGDNKFVVRVNGATTQIITSNIPAATTDLTVRHQAINVTATDINLKMRGIMVGIRRG